MKQFKKAVSLLAVIAFLITALVPVAGLAADPVPLYSAPVTVARAIGSASTPSDDWATTAGGATPVDVYQWAGAPVTIQLAQATGRDAGDYTVAKNVTNLNNLTDTNFSQYTDAITDAAATAAVTYTVLRYEKTAADTGSGAAAVYWYAVVAVKPVKGTLTAGNPSATSIAYGATTGVPTIAASWTAAPVDTNDTTTLTLPNGNNQPPVATSGTPITYTWACKKSNNDPVNLTGTNAQGANGLTLTTPTNIAPGAYTYSCAATSEF